MDKLPIGLGILSWRSNQSIQNTLRSLQKNGLLDFCSSQNIFFQEVRKSDKELAERYQLRVISSIDNVGIGKAFLELAESIQEPYIILLEHDWQLVANRLETYKHLADAIYLLESGVSCVRLRHRRKYGNPHYSIGKYFNNELEYYDDWIKLHHPHLIDTLHWVERPDLRWPDKIEKIEDFFFCDSRYANWTNNPCLFEREFFINTVKEFVGDGIELERNISYWWARQNFKVAQGEGLFMHNDKDKYKISLVRVLKKLLGMK
jgi:hypothetical protein